jgi:hypothetical protein
MKRAYTVFALSVLGLWGASSWLGWELFAAQRGKIPASVRQAPGGYRSFAYWRGGK